ncbi:MAG: TonB-dependent receptor [Bryobacterales bacterium]|nr:TonB-dependent receptor [Bryobacterales bacterium]
MLQRLRLLCFTALSLIPCAHAQTTNSSILGAVADATGAAIPGAGIVLTNSATRVQRTVESAANGEYRFFPLGAGIYELAVEKNGFKKRIQSRVVVGVAESVKVDFQLQVGDVATAVDVSDVATLLQTQETSVGGAITGAELTRLPVNGRNYTRLILLLPGTSDRAKSQTNGTVSGTNLYSVNGQRSQDNNFTLDGVENNLFRMNSPGASPPMDSMQEFRVMTGASSEFGRSAGANVNMVTKSGTRDLHGSVYEFFRNDKLDANDFFANRENRGKVPYRQNQYGVSLGGPVVLPKLYNGRDRTFWFVNWEGFRSRRGSTALGTVPVAAQRTGDFSGQPRLVYDPLAAQAGPTGAAIRQPFAGNIIPGNRISPASRFILDTLVPLPDRAGLTQNFVNTESSVNDRAAIITRIDHMLSRKDTLSFRYFNQRVQATTPSAFPSYFAESRFDAHNLSATWDRIVSPTSVFEFKFGYHDPFVPSVTRNRLITRSEFLEKTGIKMFQADTAFSTIPIVNVSGQFNLAGSGVGSGDHVYQFAPSFTKTHGSHNLKFGLTYSRREYFYDGSTPMHGTAVFDQRLTELASAANTGHSTASFLLGYPSSIERGEGSAATNGRQNAYHFYAQNDWRATSRLTVNLGVRYEINNPPYDTTDNVGTLLVSRDGSNGKYTGTLLWGNVNPRPDPLSGRVNEPARTAGYGRTLQTSDWNNFAPRIGIAYQINRLTVVRAGASVFYNSTFFQELQDKRKFYPYNTSQFFTANTGLTPDLSITGAGPSYNNTTAIGGWAQNPSNRTPYSQQWNLFVQRQLPSEVVLNVGYVGSSNHRQIGYIPINAATAPGSSALQSRRLMPEYGDINGGLNDFNSNYHGLQASAVKRFNQGLSFQVNYTWSRAMDYQSSLAETKTQNPFNRAADYSRSSWDLRHVFQFAYVYELPMGRGRRFGGNMHKALDYAIGGWSLEGIARFQSGGPVNITIGQDRANIGSSTQRPDALRNPNTGPRTPEQWFDTSAFQMPAIYTYGSAGAYLVDSDGRHNFDFSIAKSFRIAEQHAVSLRGEFFNLTNSVSMSDPTGSLTSATFGRVASATAARQIQLALRYSF